MIAPEIIQMLMPRIEQKLMPIPACGCIVYMGALNGNGYGNVGIWNGGQTKNWQVHQITYEAEFGPVPDGLELDHKCRVRSCCNPLHLEPVTHRENMLRGDTVPAKHAKKTHCPSGHPYAGANLYIGKKGNRVCRQCDADKHARIRIGKKDINARNNH